MQIAIKQDEKENGPGKRFWRELHGEGSCNEEYVRDLSLINQMQMPFVTCYIALSLIVNCGFQCTLCEGQASNFEFQPLSLLGVVKKGQKNLHLVINGGEDMGLY